MIKLTRNFKLISILILILFYCSIFKNSVVLSKDNSIEKEKVIKTGGFADLNGGTTGGAGGKEVTVTDLKSFRLAVSGFKAKIIYVSGYIELDKGSYMSVKSNKSIIGINNAKIRYGGLLLENVRNIIIKNIEFCDAVTLGSGTELDCISILEGTTNVWIDHCTFSDDPASDPVPAKHHDGAIDIKRGSNYVTISYCEFHNHDKTCLLGHSDNNGSQDRDKLKVTYHHNFFNGTYQRHPRVRFGESHVYNNYYLANGVYGIGCGYEAKIYSENNYFENVNIPFQYINDTNGTLKDIGSYFVKSGNPKIKDGNNWDLKNYYVYIADPGENVKDICLKFSGAGKPER